MSALSRPVSRYQRRILAWGGGVACLLYVVGAPIYLDQVERDLTDRVSAELTAAGFDGVTVSFAGQTGTIDCSEPIGDPRAALDLAYTVRGVRAINDLPDSCRVLGASGSDGPIVTDPAEGADAAEAAITTSDPDSSSTTATTTTTTATTGTVADFATVLEVLGGNPQFSLLHQLVQDSELSATLTGSDHVTLFAPTNAAFDALSADAVAQLRSDRALLDRVLGHHLVAGWLLAGDLATGSLLSVAGDELVIDAEGDAPLIGGASIVEPDVLAANGVVHAVDALLLPADVDLTAPERLAAMTATYAGGRYLLEGVVRSEVERAVIVAAAAAAVGADAVTDQLTVDPDLGLGEPTAQALATLVSVVATNLVEGTAGFDGESLAVSGTYADTAASATVEQAAASVGAESTLTERPVASEADAETLEAELNSFVAANPILFEPNASVLDDSALPILDEVAGRLQAVTGVTITVEGHTDSDGDAEENLILSQVRAVTVQAALVERGVDPESITAEGFGSARPVLVDGVEDKDASRRVEFRVAVSG